MRLSSVYKQFLDRLTLAGLELAELTPATGIELMLQFYLDERVSHCLLDEDGDLLLFQWGSYDWGQGEHFELNISRQLMTAAGDGIEQMRQLSLTFRYPPSPQWKTVGEGNLWCDTPEDVQAFARSIQNCRAMKLATQQQPAAVDLTFDEI